MMRTSKKKNLGFTLIEVLVSIAMLALLFVPMMGYFTNTSKVNARAKNNQRATTVAQSVIEEMKSYDNIEAIMSAYTYHTPGAVSGGSIADENFETRGRVPSASQTGTSNYITDPYYPREERATVGDSGTYYFVKKGIENDGKKFDALIKVNTNSYAMNDMEVAKITSLNSNENIVAKEQSETLTAIYGFLCKNIAACDRAGIGATDSRRVSEDTIKNNLKKTVVIKVLPGSDPSDTRRARITIYNEYTVNPSAGILGCKNPNKDYLRSNYLYNEEVSLTDATGKQVLQGIYVFYNYDVLNAGDKIMQGISMEVDASIAVTMPKFKLFGICQKIYDIGTESALVGADGKVESVDKSVYTISVDIASDSGNSLNIPYFSNLNSMNKGIFKAAEDMNGIVGTEKLDRLSEVTVAVFDAGANMSEDVKQWVKITSARGE